MIAAAMSNRAPVDQSTPAIDVRAAPRRRACDVTLYLATAGYFETVGIPVLQGRPSLLTADSESRRRRHRQRDAGRALWPDGDVLGRPLYLAEEARPVRVVGVARNSKYRSMNEPPRAHVYRPSPPTLGMTLLARTSGDPREALRALQRTLDGVGPGVVGFFPRTLDDHLAIDLLPTRAAAAAATGSRCRTGAERFGLYGLVAWFVELRRREIGVRMALGARAGCAPLVVGQALATALPGIVGVLLAWACLLARAALFEWPARSRGLAAGVGALDAVVVAAYVPSRRATRVDPVSLYGTDAGRSARRGRRRRAPRRWLCR